MRPTRQTISLKELRRLLLCDCSLAVDNPSWLIYQNSVQDFIRKGSRFLVDALCAASGTKLFNDLSREAERKLSKCTVNKAEIRANVQLLQARMKKEMRYYDDLDKAAKLDTAAEAAYVTWMSVAARYAAARARK